MAPLCQARSCNKICRDDPLLIQVKAKFQKATQPSFKMLGGRVVDFGSQMFLLACVGAIVIFAATLFAVSLIAPGSSNQR